MTVPDDRGIWRKSSRSQTQDECVEIKLATEEVGIRDTKDRVGGQLAVPASGWSAFINGLKTD